MKNVVKLLFGVSLLTSTVCYAADDHFETYKVNPGDTLRFFYTLPNGNTGGVQGPGIRDNQTSGDLDPAAGSIKIQVPGDAISKRVTITDQNGVLRQATAENNL